MNDVINRRPKINPEKNGKRKPLLRGHHSAANNM